MATKIILVALVSALLALGASAAVSSSKGLSGTNDDGNCTTVVKTGEGWQVRKTFASVARINRTPL
jgi:hypothetical protein